MLGYCQEPTGNNKLLFFKNKNQIEYLIYLISQTYKHVNAQPPNYDLSTPKPNNNGIKESNLPQLTPIFVSYYFTSSLDLW